MIILLSTLFLVKSKLSEKNLISTVKINVYIIINTFCFNPTYFYE